MQILSCHSKRGLSKSDVTTTRAVEEPITFFCNEEVHDSLECEFIVQLVTFDVFGEKSVRLNSKSTLILDWLYPVRMKK